MVQASEIMIVSWLLRREANFSFLGMQMGELEIPAFILSFSGLIPVQFW